MGHAEWKRIAEDIRDNYDKYNAFLILHGVTIEKYTLHFCVNSSL